MILKNNCLADTKLIFHGKDARKFVEVNVYLIFKSDRHDYDRIRSAIVFTTLILYPFAIFKPDDRLVGEILDFIIPIDRDGFLIAWSNRFKNIFVFVFLDLKVVGWDFKPNLI